MSMPVPVQPDISDDDVAAAQPAPEPLESQRLFELHDANMQRVEELYGKALDAMDGAELLALQSAIINRLEVTTDEQLSGAVTGQDAALSLADVGRIAEENHRRFYNFQCRLAFLLEGWFESIDARSATLAHKGKRPFKDSKDFIARLIGIDNKEVERRLRIATANPTKPGASKMRAPKIVRAMADGKTDPASANYIVDRLRSIRAASKRAGATDEQADRLVATKEGELLAKALHAGPDEVRKFADRVKRCTNRQFTKPGTRLTPKQRQYEEGLRYVSPLGDNHIRLDWVLTKWQYRNVLERLRRQVNNLRKEISRINDEDHLNPDGSRKSGAERITAADEEYEIPMLYDNRTPAQRWSHFLLDILETGIVLTSLPAGNAQDQINQHSNNVDQSSSNSESENVHPEDITPSGVIIPGLGRLVNVLPEVTVGLQFSDLAGKYLDFGSDDVHVQREIAALIEGRKPFPELYDYEAMDLDWAQLRMMACNASIIPAVLNSKSEPLDVGRSQRSFPVNIHRGVVLRDGGCAYPGCNMPHMYCEVHHIQHWENGGCTSLDNAVMLCRFHHMVIHQSEVLVRLNDDQFPEFLINPTTPEAIWVRNHVHRG